MLPAKQEELVSYGYQLLQYILDGPKSLIGLCMGYTGSNKFSDNIEAFVRKSIEPFVVAIRTYIELCFIDCEDVAENQENKVVTIFLSYCTIQFNSFVFSYNNILNLYNRFHFDKIRLSREFQPIFLYTKSSLLIDSYNKHRELSNPAIHFQFL